MEFYPQNFKSYGQQIGHTKIHMKYFDYNFFQEEKKIGTREICFSEERRSNDDVIEIYKCRRSIKYVKI